MNTGPNKNTTIKNLEKEKQEVEFAKKLIKEGKGNEVDFKKLPEYARVEIAKLLIEKGYGHIVFFNLDTMPVASIDEVFNLLTKKEFDF